MGESILKANQYDFKELHSIEINELFLNRGLEEIKKLKLEKKIHIFI